MYLPSPELRKVAIHQPVGGGVIGGWGGTGVGGIKGRSVGPLFVWCLKLADGCLFACLAGVPWGGGGGAVDEGVFPGTVGVLADY